MSELIDYARTAELVGARPPLLMIDRMEVDADAAHARALKNTSADEHHFAGHFPDMPVMPGVLQIAAMSQVAGAMLRRRNPDASDTVPWLTELGRVKFRNPVQPGDRLVVDVELVEESSPDAATFRARAHVGDTLTSQGSLSLRLVPTASLLTPPQGFMPAAPQYAESAEAPALDTIGIMRTIPHRFPFLLIDRALVLDWDQGRAVALKNVTGNEPFFAGSTLPIMPVYLQLEAAAQAGCALAMSSPAADGRIGYFMSVDTATFHGPVVPGDQLLIDLALVQRSRYGTAEGTVRVGGRVVTELALKFAMIERE